MWTMVIWVAESKTVRYTAHFPPVSTVCVLIFGPSTKSFSLLRGIWRRYVLIVYEVRSERNTSNMGCDGKRLSLSLSLICHRLSPCVVPQRSVLDYAPLSSLSHSLSLLLSVKWIIGGLQSWIFRKPSPASVLTNHIWFALFCSVWYFAPLISHACAVCMSSLWGLYLSDEVSLLLRMHP